MEARVQAIVEGGPMMPFPDLELVRIRTEDLRRRAERERLLNEALASRPRRH